MTTGTPFWSPRTRTRPTLQGPHAADLCVVGLGASGLSAIHAGLEAGLSVVGIDATHVAGGAAGLNGGFLLAGTALFHHHARARYGVDVAVELYRQTALEIRQIVADSASARRSGSLRIAADDDERADIEAQYDALMSDGLGALRYEGPEGEGLLVPGDGVFDPAARCHELASAAEASGALLYEATPATAITQDRVETPEGHIVSSDVVVAVDGGLEALFPELDASVTSWRLQMLGTAPVPHAVSSYAVYHRGGLDYWQQRPDGRIALGGGRDFGGVDERNAPRGVSESVQNHLDAVLRERLQVRAAVTHRWSARSAYSEDRLPICQRIGGVHVAGAYAGHGNVIGAICGREMVQRITGQPTPFVDLLKRARNERA